MATSLFINVLPAAFRLAVLQDERLVRLEIVARRSKGPATAGAIFLGRVSGINTGIQAAFIDIGGKRHAFLNRRDLPPRLLAAEAASLESVLKEGRTLLVQVTKPGYEGKLPQVSGDLKLLGFSCILLPCSEGVRFSRQFTGERKPIREALAEVQGDRTLGWIVRSAATPQAAATIAAEAKVLIARLAQLEREAEKGAPRQLYADDPIEEFLREYTKELPRSIYVDDEGLFAEVQERLRLGPPHLLAALKLHGGPSPLFDVYKIETEIMRASAAHVWLPSGGSLVFRQTEAMVTIDVNSGKNIKKRAGQSAALRTDLEAAVEIAHQLRVRNLAGLIVIDFINATEPGWRKLVDDACRTALAADPLAPDYLPINRFGLAHLTRARQRNSLAHVLQEPCPRCAGSGRIERLEIIALEIQRRLQHEAAGLNEPRMILRCHPELASYLDSHRKHLLAPLEQALAITIAVEEEATMPPRAYSLDL